MKSLIASWNKISIVQRIIIGMVIGILFALFIPEQTKFVSIFGSLFVSALKAVAPILVLFLVSGAISQHQDGQKSNMKDVIVLYLLGTFLAATVAVAASFLFPVQLDIPTAAEGAATAPSNVIDVLKKLLLNIVDNPVNALLNANYIGILAWAVVLGLALRKAAESTKVFIRNVGDALAQIVKWVIGFAPLGIMGLIYDAIATSGLQALLNYGSLLLVLVGSMAFVALVVNPIMVYVKIRQNPYPLVFKCLKDSGITAFFTRSSAANIPVNMEICRELGLDEDTYSVSIPLGATINMAGAAITITVLTLAAANTLGVPVDFGTAIILSVLAAVSACGASGVAGGSLLLIPLACSLFGIDADTAMGVVGAGFIIGVIQDSCETALNSSTDLLFTAAAEFADWRKAGKPISFKSEMDIE